jgi:hypothetical protein
VIVATEWKAATRLATITPASQPVIHEEDGEQ